MSRKTVTRQQTMREEVLEGLSRPQKRLPSKYFYDRRGSELFEHITRLDEYYLTRAEKSILEDHAEEMAERIGARAALVDLGSGSSRKTRLLLEKLPELQAYVPVDISREYLRTVSRELRREYPEMAVLPVCADYTSPFELPELPGETRRVAVFFPGSTIGNYLPSEARSILSRIAGLLGPGGTLLVGVDLKKDPEILEAAYNDSRGLTAAFNRNILRHLNRELEGDFEPSRFEHRACYNRDKGRIEMHLVAQSEQQVRIGGQTFHLEKGESIHTENSHKYTLEEFRELSGDPFKVEEVWTDARAWYALQLLKKTNITYATCMNKAISSLSTSELAQQLDRSDSHLVDIRPLAAYNGWPLEGEPRGGHLPGAKSIPLAWTRYMDWVEVLEEKGLRRDKPVTVYGYGEEDTADMAEKLRRLDYEKVRTYSGFLREWSPGRELPLERLPRYRHLVYPGWIKELVDGERPPHYNSQRFVICHSHYDHIEDYHRGHIPGAVPVDTNSLESPETWNRRSPDELKSTLEKLGIRHDTTVVLYGRFSSPVFNEDPFPGKSAGHLGALRCAAIMLYAGVEDVRILNGGITSWEDAGYELSQEPAEPAPAGDFGREVPGHPEYMVDMPKARELLASPEGELVSIRSWEEFTGGRSGYHYIEKKGRIPGALFGNCGSDAYHMENYRNFDHTMREYPEVARAWKEGGITPDKHLAFYCGTGWRGSEAFLNAWLMGWPRVSVYDGGWYEWCNDPSNPIATGEPENRFYQPSK